MDDIIYIFLLFFFLTFFLFWLLQLFLKYLVLFSYEQKNLAPLIFNVEIRPCKHILSIILPPVLYRSNKNFKLVYQI